jgi:hypothetical protein
MMNGYPKHVASTTLQEPLGWNNSTIIKGNIPEEVDKLKRQPGKDILVFGSAAGEDVDGARPHRRVPPDGFPDHRGQRQAPLRGRGGRESPKAGGLEDVRHGVVSLAYRPERS